MEHTIRAAFRFETVNWGISDEFIEGHPNLLEIAGEIDPMSMVPAYMAWCVRNKDRYDQVVTDYTIDAIAVYGRSGDGTALSGFKRQCSGEQRHAVVAFLEWCTTTLTVVDNEQIERSIKRWLADTWGIER